MLTVHQASELCGYGRSALHHWLDAGKIKGLNYRRATLLSKESLACWLASPGGQNIAALSEQHLAWMKDFQAVKQNSGMGRALCHCNIISYGLCQKKSASAGPFAGVGLELLDALLHG